MTLHPISHPTSHTVYTLCQGGSQSTSLKNLGLYFKRHLVYCHKHFIEVVQRSKDVLVSPHFLKFCCIFGPNFKMFQVLPSSSTQCLQCIVTHKHATSPKQKLLNFAVTHPVACFKCVHINVELNSEHQCGFTFLLSRKM